MTHTPGPWRLWLSEADRGAFMLHGDSPEPHGADMVITQRAIGTPNGDEGVANARLMAAAPELLAALKRQTCGRCLRSVANPPLAHNPCPVCAPDVAAIAKAEGA